MGIVVVPTYGADPVSVTGPNLDAKVAGLATEFNGSIDNDNIKPAAGILASKLDLSTVAQSIAMSSKDISEAKGADLSSATTTTIWVTDGNFIHITGTTTITSFGTAQQAGDARTIVFDGILTLTHNATSLILPSAANITTAAGDRAIVRAETTANARVIDYIRADGTPLAGGVTAAAQSDQETATSTTTYVSPGRQQFHPSASKAWGTFNGTGTPAFTRRYNMDATITDNGTGDYSVTFTTDFSDATYAFMGSGTDASAGANNQPIVCLHDTTTKVAGGCRIKTANPAGTLTDFPEVYFATFGDQ